MSTLNANAVKTINDIVVKKGGIKLIDLAKELTSVLGTEIKTGDVKPIVEGMFADKLIDLIEYRTPSAVDKPKMFLIPVGTKVVHGEDDAPESEGGAKAVPAEFTDVAASNGDDELIDVETEEIILPETMISEYAVLTADGIESFVDIEMAQGAYLKAKGEAKDQIEAREVKLFGMIPIKFKFQTFLDVPEDLDGPGDSADLSDIEDTLDVAADGSTPSSPVDLSSDDNPFAA